MGIRNAFDPIDPSELGPPAYTTVQASLFNRLRKSHGKNAGNLAWLLVRLAQPDHREHEDAIALILERDAASLAALLSIVGAARAAARPPGARAMLAAIVEALETAQVNAIDREKHESKKRAKP